MNFQVLNCVLIVLGSATCDIYYRLPNNPGTYVLPNGYNGRSAFPSYFERFGNIDAPRSYEAVDKGKGAYYDGGETDGDYDKGYGEQDVREGGYYSADKADGDYYRGDVLRHEVHDAQDSGLKAVSGANGIHAVAVDTKGRQDYAGHSSARGLQAAGEAATGKVQEYGTSGNEGYNGFGKSGYKKGHSNSGFHKSYSNEESGKDSKFIDEDLKVGGETTVKYYGDKFGHSGKTGYGEAVKGFGYDHMTKGGGAARTGLDSNAKHDIIQGEHGHKGGYNNKDSFVRDYGAGSYHDGQQKAGQSYGTSDHINTIYHKPMYL